MPQPRTKSKPRLGLGDLSPEERAELIAELRAEASRPAVVLEARPLTPRERAIRLLLPDRAHFEGCPILDDEDRAVGRIEAYRETRPADPRTMTPAAPVTVARCMECGGSRVHEGPLEAVLLAKIGDQPTDTDAAGTLDGALT